MVCLNLIVASAKERNHLLKKVEQLKHSSSTQYDGPVPPEKVIMWYLPTALQDQDLRCRVPV